MERWATLACFLFGLGACQDDIKDDFKYALPSKAELFGEGDEPSGVNPPVTSQCIAWTERLPAYYTPGAADAFPACLSDDGKFHPSESDARAPSSTKAFEEIEALLFDPEQDGTQADFLVARKLYDQAEGIGSRVVTCYDPHYGVKGKVDCTKEREVLANPDYCAGPAKISRIMQTSLRAGAEGKDPRWHAGRIEGALLWFLTISVYQQTLSCSEEDVQDCASSYELFDAAGAGLGLGGYIQAVDPDAYAAATLGALAVSCWRENDRAVPAMNLTLRDQARTQFDRGVLRGVASVLLQRIAATKAATGEARRFHWGFLTAYLGAIESQSFRATGSAKVVAAARMASTPEEISLSKLTAALNDIVECAG